MTVKPFPYAANAIITHIFDTDHLDIWMVFRHPMDQTQKPADNLWIVNLDTVTKAVTASAWQDAFTMKLTVGAIASIPTIVTVEYDGPSPLLTTTWDKQWEPWGAILSSDGSLLPYGSFKGNEIAWSQVAAQNVWYTISDADISIDYQNKMLFQNNQEFKIAVAGFYSTAYYLSMRSSIANKHILAAPEINGVEQLGGRNHILFGAPNVELPISGTSIMQLSVDDIVSVGVSTENAGNPTITVDHIGLVITEIGPTS